MAANRPTTDPARAATAVACSNIALAKYWGKIDVALNLPAVPSISMTLDGLTTRTTVVFDAGLRRDRLWLDGKEAKGKPLARVVAMLDRVRALSGQGHRARVETRNDFPTAAGLASSASGFAALAAAACSAAGVTASDRQLSQLARQASASAARSIYGGFVELPAGKVGKANLAAKPLHGRDHWDVAMVIALTAVGAKDVGSTEGMERSRRTSPYYEPWVAAAPRLCKEVRTALASRDLERLGRAMEQSTLAFHACAMAAAPGIIYFLPATLAALATVRRLRDRGTAVFATMDAGPHVKALCSSKDVAAVRRALGRTEGVRSTLVARPGPGVIVTGGQEVR